MTIKPAKNEFLSKPRACQVETLWPDTLEKKDSLNVLNLLDNRLRLAHTRYKVLTGSGLCENKRISFLKGNASRAQRTNTQAIHNHQIQCVDRVSRYDKYPAAFPSVKIHL